MRVFTWEEVQNRRVPNVARLFETADRAREHFENQPWLQGGLILGSVLMREANCASDFDLFLVFNRVDREACAASVGQFTSTALQRDDVLVNAVTMTTESVGHSLHRITASYLAHLRWATARGGVIKHDPVPYIREPTTDLTDEAVAYAQHKLAKLESGFARWPALTPQEQAGLLAQALDAPMHLARKYLQAIDDLKDPGMPRNLVVRHLHEHNPQLGLQLRRIETARNAYVGALHAQQAEKNREAYIAQLAELYALRSQVLSFLEGGLCHPSEPWPPRN